jgi:nucleoside-diphosphate-sugar epimerase
MMSPSDPRARARFAESGWNHVVRTGATGYLGRAVAQRLSTAGHTVTGLVRDDLGVRTLARSGIDPVVGDLGDPSSLRAAVEDVDAVVETASADDAASVVALLEIIAGTGRRFIRTSGTGIYTDMAGGEPSATVHTEDDGYTPIPEVGSRYHSDLLTLAAADAGNHTVVMRPSMVYGYGGSEQLPVLLRAALRDGVSRYTGRGLNRYGNVYLDDVAEAYLLALERAPAGSAYNLAAGECEMRQIAADVARLLGLERHRLDQHGGGGAGLRSEVRSLAFRHGSARDRPSAPAADDRE